MRASLGRGRSGWIAWLIAALLCVQMWGLQHEIAHARELSGSAVPAAAQNGASPAANASNVTDADDAADSDAAIAAAWSVASAPTSHSGFGSHHHHCHLFEGATLAAAMAVAVLQWTGGADASDAPLRANGRSHASAVVLPFDSRAPPVSV
ncbi:hypothetical protein [Pandoraea sp. NPDC087047]|uniref:hypothetical protein n=1 Tax=Pandoraea sp. NPDC087047 TaxID=3364390 RepID=UPI00382E5F69